MQFQYNLAVDPPAPFIELTIGDLRGLQQLSLSFQVDTGSDFSALPASEVTLLQLPFLDMVDVISFKSESKGERRYGAYLERPGREAILAKFLAWDEPYGLAGLDVLNLFRMTLDGPQLQLTLEEP